MAEVQITISLLIGFGWSAESGPKLEADGTRCLTYRYIPPGCWCPDVQMIRAYINAAAKVFPSYDLFPPDLLPTPPAEGAEELSAAGMAFYESCPTYAKLEAKEPWITWHQHHPEGGVAWSARTNEYKPFMDEVLSQWPINLWAQKFLDPWKDLLPPHPKGRFAMYMQPPLPTDSVPVEDEEGWSHGLDNLRADIHERIEFPWGPFKVVLVSCEEGRVPGCKKMEFSDAFKLLPCTLGYKNKPEDPFKWREHHVWRFEVPMHHVPRCLKWTEDEEVAHPGKWSVRSIVPCYGWDIADVKFQVRPGEADWDIAGVIYKPFSEMDPVALATYEHDFEEMARRGHA